VDVELLGVIVLEYTFLVDLLPHYRLKHSSRYAGAGGSVPVISIPEMFV
jgi:hypothetical protein